MLVIYTHEKELYIHLYILFAGIQGRVDIINSTLGKAMGGAMVSLKIFHQLLK